MYMVKVYHTHVVLSIFLLIFYSRKLRNRVIFYWMLTEAYNSPTNLSWLIRSKPLSRRIYADTVRRIRTLLRLQKAPKHFQSASGASYFTRLLRSGSKTTFSRISLAYCRNKYRLPIRFWMWSFLFGFLFRCNIRSNCRSRQLSIKLHLEVRLSL